MSKPIVPDVIHFATPRNTVRTFSSLDFTRQFRDADGDAFDGFVFIGAREGFSFPASGRLLLNGVDITPNTRVTAADLAAGRFKYLPPADVVSRSEIEDAVAEFAVQVLDAKGEKSDVLSVTMAIPDAATLPSFKVDGASTLGGRVWLPITDGVGNAVLDGDVRMHDPRPPLVETIIFEGETGGEPTMVTVVENAHRIILQITWPTELADKLSLVGTNGLTLSRDEQRIRFTSESGTVDVGDYFTAAGAAGAVLNFSLERTDEALVAAVMQRLAMAATGLRAGQEIPVLWNMFDPNFASDESIAAQGTVVLVANAVPSMAALAPPAGGFSPGAQLYVPAVIDADGLGTVAPTYQWFRDDTPVAGATGAQFPLTASDQGHSLRVRVNYTDGRGKPESVLSGPSPMVAAADDRLKIAGGKGAPLSMQTTLAELDSTGVTPASVRYQWFLTSDGTSTAITGATSATWSPESGSGTGAAHLLVTYQNAAGAYKWAWSNAIMLNRAPEASGGSLSLVPGEANVLALADFGITDADGDAPASIAVLTQPTIPLLLDGKPVADGQVIKAADIIAGKLTLQPPSKDWLLADALRFTASDGKDSSSPATLNLVLPPAPVETSLIIDGVPVVFTSGLNPRSAHDDAILRISAPRFGRIDDPASLSARMADIPLLGGTSAALRDMVLSLSDNMSAVVSGPATSLNLAALRDLALARIDVRFPPGTAQHEALVTRLSAFMASAQDGSRFNMREIALSSDAGTPAGEVVLSAQPANDGMRSLVLVDVTQLAAAPQLRLSGVDVVIVMGAASVSSDDAAYVVLADGGIQRIELGGGSDVGAGGPGDDLVAGGGGNDTLDGGDGVDIVNGGTGSDIVVGGAEDDLLLGDGGDEAAWAFAHKHAPAFGERIATLRDQAAWQGAGTGDNDLLWGGPGNDVLWGGEGRDAARYNGRLADAKVQRTADGWRVTDVTGADGVDQLAGIERLQFTDYTVNLEIFDLAAKLPRAELNDLIALYVGMYDRLPEADGLQFWIAQRLAGRGMNEIAEAMFACGDVQTSAWDARAPMDARQVAALGLEQVMGRSGAAVSEDTLSYWAAVAEQSGKGAMFLRMIDRTQEMAGSALSAADRESGAGLAARTEMGWEFAVLRGLGFQSLTTTIEKTTAISAAVSSQSSEAAIQLIGLSLDVVQAAWPG